MPLPKSRTKLLNLFSSIKDANLKIIISEVIDIENEYRSSRAYPWAKVEGIIDKEANRIEMSYKEGENED